MSSESVARRKLFQRADRKAGRAEITPLEYMLKVMRNTKADQKRRDEMAKAAAPYMHARLQTSAIVHSGTLTLESLVQESLRPIAPIEPVETERPATTH